MDFNIVLGCNGRSEKNGFVFCNCAENIIASINHTTQERDEILKFLDEAANMFSEDIFDFNKVMNVIAWLKDKFNLISSEEIIKIQMFCRMHKVCGIYLRIEVK